MYLRRCILVIWGIWSSPNIWMLWMTLFWIFCHTIRLDSLCRYGNWLRWPGCDLLSFAGCRLLSWDSCVGPRHGVSPVGRLSVLFIMSAANCCCFDRQHWPSLIDETSTLFAVTLWFVFPDRTTPGCQCVGPRIRIIGRVFLQTPVQIFTWPTCFVSCTTFSVSCLSGSWKWLDSMTATR